MVTPVAIPTVTSSSNGALAGLWVVARPLQAVPIEVARAETGERPSVVRQTGMPHLLASTADWQSLVSRYDDWDVAKMLKIINCESGGDENVVSPDGANVGAYQINVVHGFSYEEMTDPVRATEIAHDIYLGSGYAAWSCS